MPAERSSTGLARAGSEVRLRPSGQRQSGAVQAHDDPGRHESESERDDRNLMELLQELRVAGLGVQVLFGFLLSLPFSVRFPKLDQTQRGLYIVSLTTSALSTALLCARWPITEWCSAGTRKVVFSVWRMRWRSSVSSPSHWRSRPPSCSSSASSSAACWSCSSLRQSSCRSQHFGSRCRSTVGFSPAVATRDQHSSGETGSPW